MNDFTATIRAAIERVAPDIDASTLDERIDYREEAQLDSMDFLAVVAAVSQATGLDIAERDYPSISTIAGFAQLLAERNGHQPA